MRRRRPRVLAALILLVLALPATALALHRHVRPRRPTAKPSAGLPQVGPLYASASATAHGCTADVVHSARGNLLITAAHCVRGRGVGMIFVPGQAGASMPDGRWRVTAAYLEPAWRGHRDPEADIAFLTVAPRRIHGRLREIEQVTGAFGLATTARRGAVITVTGYPAGSTNRPITCRARVYVTRSFPAFDCRGFVAGTSGSAWVQRSSHGGAIVGVIGGLHQGGCRDAISYTSPLWDDAAVAYARAQRGAPGDVAPPAGPDGC